MTVVEQFATPISPTRMQLVAWLAQPQGRTSAARELAVTMHADSLIVFIRDLEVGALLPAPGFPQTLPDTRAWRTFVAACLERGSMTGQLATPHGAAVVDAAGYAAGPDAAWVLLGATGATADVGWFQALMPLLVAIFEAEQRAALAASKERAAHQAAARATRLVEMVDRARGQLQAALADSRESRLEVERANAQLREQADQLESQAIELEVQAAELQAANESLRHARVVADAANHAKSEFLATMSHELRTPLNAIGGHTQLIAMGLRGPVSNEQREALDRIDRAQRHLLGLINTILNLSRIEAGKVEYAMADVALGDFLSELMPMIEPLLATKSLVFEIVGAASLPVVRADPDKLEQILLNLLSNAVKFTDAGGRVWIDSDRADPASDRVRVQVGDSGRGIPSDKLEFIFEPFTQVDASHSRLGQGTGLGLAISRDLARGMGGDLEVRSALGEGSLFTLTLQVAKPDEGM